MSAVFQDRFCPLDPGSGYKEPDSWIWCGSVIHGDDGNWHMFASRWNRDVGFDHWTTNSTLVRAESSSMLGPYHYRETILPSSVISGATCKAAHNPSIALWGGLYYLFFTSIHYDGARPTAVDPAPWGSARSRQAWHSKRIALLSAPSVRGPWTVEADPLLDIRPGQWDSLITSNAAPLIHADGSVVMLYKGSDCGFGADGTFAMRLRLSVASAPNPAGPYSRSGQVILGEQFPKSDWEDPCLWNEGGRYWSLIKDFQGLVSGQPRSSSLWSSIDGQNWIPEGLGFSRKLRLIGGASQEYYLLERPQVISGRAGPVGLVLAASVLPPDHPDAFTCNHVIEIK